MRIGAIDIAHIVAPKGRAQWNVLVSDLFTRADTVDGLGTSTSGHLWISPYAHVWGITGNTGYSPTGDIYQHLVVIDSGQSKVRLSCNLTVPGYKGGLLVRYVTYDNRIFVYFDGALNLDRLINNAWARLGQAFGAWAAGTRLTVVNDGPSIKVYKGTDLVTPVIEATDDTNFLTATKQGLYTEGYAGDTGVRFDNYSVECWG